MIYYTADLHLGHANIMKYCNRPFETVAEMDGAIIDNWNSVVTNEDDVYIIGDIAFKAESAILALDRMNGHKHLIVGNHDEKLIKNNNLKVFFESIDVYKKIKDDDQTVILCHYPICEWDGFYRGSHHVFGHIHNSMLDTKDMMRSRERAYNAGVDLNDFTPQSLQSLIDKKKLGIY